VHAQAIGDIAFGDHPIDASPIDADDGRTDALLAQPLRSRRNRFRGFDGDNGVTLYDENVSYLHGTTPAS
jgi:hypothetical protein